MLPIPPSMIASSFSALFTAADMMMRFSAAYQEIDPSLQRLATRLEDLAFLMTSIHELKPKHLALSEMFRKCEEYLTKDLLHQFNTFVVKYGKPTLAVGEDAAAAVALTPKKSLIDRLGLAKPKRFIMAPHDEMIIRRLDEAVSKTVFQLNTLLQVEELYNLNNMSDAMRAVLSQLKDAPRANEKLVAAMEARVLGHMTKLNQSMSKQQKTLNAVNANVSMMAREIGLIHRKLDAMPKYLVPIKNTEVRDLWRHRQWSDAIELDRFSRAVHEFLCQNFPALAVPTVSRLTDRMYHDVFNKLTVEGHGVRFMVPSDLDALIPPDASLLDHFLGVEFGWAIVIESLVRKLTWLRESSPENPHKAQRLIDEYNRLVEAVAAKYPIDADMKPNVVFLYDGDNQRYEACWTAPAIDLVRQIRALVTMITQRQVQDILADFSFARDVAMFSAAHYSLSVNAPALLQELTIDVNAVGGFLDAVSPDDAAQDEAANSKLADQRAAIQRNLQRILAKDVWDGTDSLAPLSPQDMQAYFIVSSSFDEVSELAVPGMTLCYSATLRGIPALIRPLVQTSLEDLPDDLIMHLRARATLRQPHPALLHIHGLTIVGHQWALVTEAPAKPFQPLAEVLANGAESPLSLRAKIDILHDIASALQTMHELGLPLGTLSTHSILLDRRRNVKVVGAFHVSNWQSPKDDAADGGRYLAPEVFRGGMPLLPSDVWSFGAVMHALLTETEFLAFATEEFATLIPKLNNGVPVPPVPGIDADLADLCTACLTQDVLARPQLEGVRAALDAAYENVKDVPVPATAPTTPRANAAAFPPLPPSRTASMATTMTGFDSEAYRPASPRPPSYHSHAPGLTRSEYASSVYSVDSDSRAVYPVRNVFRQALEIYNHGAGDVVQAIRLFESAYINHRQFEALVYLGDIYYYGNAKHRIKPKYSLAYDYYYKATQNGMILGHVGLGDCYLFNLGVPDANQPKETRLRQAAHHYDLAFRNTNSPTARLLCGLADLEYYKHQGELRTQFKVIPLSDGVLRKYQDANQLEPGYYRAQLGLADCCLARGQEDQALEIYMDVAESMPKLKRPYVGLALATRDPVERNGYGTEAEALDKADF
ncbi:serine/threonine protein kinase [Allomyces macrogynus ATCC 38327]|uniref:Serine/threonine protein kinase n=1 Tax=Allomyces macrogynus (strain ATCC 38327) TaxID=578462 RepID=A0A0L0SCC9_ALLM3|nr:serine/threonine protein kinase [Allomyces macrogynus ATCC 38327]|eukprot:KNE60040.1 serine/threonine protein kinase [Allomyces macrogynus ATCC 38327]